MTTSETTRGRVQEILGRHMLVQGLPVVVDLEASRGARLVDAETGESFLDFFASFSSSPLGFNHPDLMRDPVREELLRAAVNKVANSDLHSAEMARFVERFATVVPPALRSHLFFIDGGALAVENALKTAFDWKHRHNVRFGRSAAGSQILHFREAFHGRSGYTLSLTNTDPKKTDYFPKLDWPRISNPKLAFPLDERGALAVEREEQAALAEISRALEERRDDIAALIIEPIQGEGGDNHFRGEFLRALREVADRNDLLLIFDEVQTGFGTTGRWWCCEHFDVTPDILVFGKKTQVCGIAVSSRIDDVDSVFHVRGRINSTWGGNLVDMVRCRHILDTIEHEDLLANARRTGAHLLAALEELGGSPGSQVSNARGRGLLLAFDLPDPDTRDRLVRRLFDLRLLALPCGARSIRFRPPLNLTPEEAEAGLAVLREALRSL